MRRISLAAALLLLPQLALAQEPAPAAEPPATALRVSLAADAAVDEVPTDVNTIQAFVFTQLHQLGLRVDSLTPTRQKAYEKWIKQQESRWAKKEPEAPAASLSITARQFARYNGAKFYGQTQAHVFKGGLEAEIKGSEGQSLATIRFKFEWGKAVKRILPDGSLKRFTQLDVQKEFDEILQKALVCGLLCDPAIRERIPADRQAKVKKYVAKTRKYLLGILDTKTGATRDGEVATFLRGLSVGE